MIAPSPMISTETITAFQSDSFVESIGVNTHWAFTGVYSNNYATLRNKLGESGIRYVRDGTFSDVFTRANDLYNSFGIKTNMLTGRWIPGYWPAPLDPTQIDAELNDIKTLALQTVAAIEAPNEYDHSHGPDADWVSTIRNYSMLLYNKVKADPLLRNFSVIGPSFGTFETYHAVGSLDSYIYYGNQHMYYWTYWPGFSGFDSNGSYSIDWFLNTLAPEQSPSRKPIQATETGHTTFTELGGISEEADGKYTLRILAEFFRRGIYRTYKYELVDQALPDREGFFGLLRNNLTEKPSFRAVKNLISILNDKGSSFAPNALTYTLTGNLTNVRQLLFQKRNGDFYLMIWNEVSSWDVAHKFDLYPLPQQLQLSLQSDYILADATLYTFNNNADLQTINLSINNNQVNFNATDTVSIIRLKNGTNSSSGTSTTAETEIGGVYRITPKYAPQSGLYAIGDQNYAFVSQSQYSGGTNQQWIVESLTDDYYRIKNRAGTRVLNVYGCSPNDGGVIQLHDWLNSDCQKWKFELLSNGYYRITPKHALNQSLDVQMCTTVGGIIVQQWSWSNSECQQWKLEKIGLAV
ncbi:unnamed protein product [Adineta steineri]|uniref:Ricin B lectin domain-containing protein n=2 Tax=Adineta steineri TaxID=433720 RepID=A0A813X217_9BILA|nr:unnamed protein product [Adineta steineri]